MLSRTAFYSGEGVLVSAVGICADSEPILNFLECSAVDGRQILPVAEIRQVFDAGKATYAIHTIRVRLYATVLSNSAT
jgi:hypothetical protein